MWRLTEHSPWPRAPKPTGPWPPVGFPSGVRHPRPMEPKSQGHPKWTRGLLGCQGLAPMDEQTETHKIKGTHPRSNSKLVPEQGPDPALWPPEAPGLWQVTGFSLPQFPQV